MDANELNELGIAADTDDLVDLSLAIASRGVLEGVADDPELLFKPGQWEESLAAAIGGTKYAHWRAPGSVHATGEVGNLSAIALAGAWRGSIANLGQHVRIAVEPAIGGPRWSADAALIAKPFATLKRHGHIWPGIGATSVFTQADLSPVGLKHWPLHIGILPGETARELAKSLGAISMVRRGLANVSILGKGESACDLLIAPFPLRELRGRALSYGFMPSANTVVVPREGLQNMAQRAVLLKRLHEDVGTSVVVAGMPYAGLESRWVNEVVRSLSHNEPLDVALWDADRETRAFVGEGQANLLRPPMIFANPASISTSPLDLQVRDLQVRLARMGQAFTLDSDTRQQLRFQGHPEAAMGAADISAGLKELRFDRESDGASVVAEIAGSVAAAETEDAGSGARPPLFGDVTFVDMEAKRRVDDLTEPLVSGKDYYLEVALRQVPSGVSHRGVPPKPVAPLPADKEIELLVVLQSSDADFRITQPTLALMLPADLDKDSSVARVVVRPLRNTPTKDQLCCLEVRIYFEFNLLEVLIVRAAVREQYGSLPGDLMRTTPIFVEQDERVERGYQQLGRWQTPRHLSIDVRRDGDAARFTFTARQDSGAGQADIVLPGRIDIPLSRLMPELNRMRQLWEEVAVILIGATLQPSDRVFQDTLLRLAGAGRDLWTLLFRGAQGSSMYVIGQWLWAHPAQTGAVIDVRLLDGAAAFAFPWSLLYDRELAPGAKKAEPDGFWGMRYAIGQSALDWPYQGDEPLVPSPASRLEFMLWGAFPNGAEQMQLLKDLEASSNKRLTVQPAITSKPAFNDMVQDCDADMLYFYAHGHTRPVAADNGYDPVQRIKERFEQLTQEQRAASGLQPLYELITDKDFKPDESWIALTLGRLKLQELRAQPMNLRRAPVVFLNMCQSAQVMPGLADSFVTFFLERNARSVLGTECPMTTVFAHPFSEKVLREFFAGQSLGESLRIARKHFMAQRNPLGLAYSLFGAATVRYEPALL